MRRPRSRRAAALAERHLRVHLSAEFMSRSCTAGSRGTIGRCCSPICYPGPVLRISGGPSHGLIDPPSDRSPTIAERIPTSPRPDRLRADPRGRRDGTEAIPDRDRPVTPVEPRADRPAPAGAHRPALAADLRATEGPDAA